MFRYVTQNVTSYITSMCWEFWLLCKWDWTKDCAELARATSSNNWKWVWRKPYKRCAGLFSSKWDESMVLLIFLTNTKLWIFFATNDRWVWACTTLKRHGVLTFSLMIWRQRDGQQGKNYSNITHNMAAARQISYPFYQRSTRLLFYTENAKQLITTLSYWTRT